MRLPFSWQELLNVACNTQYCYNHSMDILNCFLSYKPLYSILCDQSLLLFKSSFFNTNPNFKTNFILSKCQCVSRRSYMKAHYSIKFIKFEARSSFIILEKLIIFDIKFVIFDKLFRFMTTHRF